MEKDRGIKNFQTIPGFIVLSHDRTHNAEGFVTIALTPGGAIDQVNMKAISPLTDFSFDFHDLVLKPVGR